MRSRILAWAKPVAGFGVLGFLLWRLGAGPFVQGLRMIDGKVLVATLLVGALTTVCCAWRWSTVAGGLGVHLPLRAAVAHCYRAVFLNATLPSGVVGDVHRAVAHGRDAGDVARGVRAVVWERSAGLVVQVALAIGALCLLPSPVRPVMPYVAAGALLAGLVAVVVVRVLPQSGLSRWARAVRASRSDIRHGLLAGRRWVPVVVASAVVIAGNLAVFVLAAQAAGAVAPLSRLVPLTLLALLAMVLPINVGGFGPREGVAAWAFGAAGLTASQGVSTAVVYGALVLVSSLPGALVLLGPRLRRVWRASAARFGVSAA